MDCARCVFSDFTFYRKIFGKKQLSQLSFFEYVTGLAIKSMGAEMNTGLDRNMFYGLAAVIIFTALSFFEGSLAFVFTRKREQKG